MDVWGEAQRMCGGRCILWTVAVSFACLWRARADVWRGCSRNIQEQAIPGKAVGPVAVYRVNINYINYINT
eukprot:350269-Chlamydomonas_euryale.AAC.3